MRKVIDENLKGTLVTLLILFVVAVVLATPWYQLTTSQEVTNTFTQTFTTTSGVTFQVASTSQRAQTVYTLPSPITVQGTPNFVNCISAPSASICGAWSSTPFILEEGSSISVTCTCHGVLAIYGTYPPYRNVDFTLNGRPPTNEMIVPVTGLYNFGIINLETYPVTESGLTVIEQTPVTMSLTDTNYYTGSNTEFNTLESTVASLTQVAPYSVIGILPSGILLVLICVIVLFVGLFEREIISVSVGRKRRRRRK